MTTGIIVAAGKSERMGNNLDKAFLALGPQPVLAYSLRKFQECSDIQSIILVVRKDQVVSAQGIVQLFGISKLREIVIGGKRRQDSVKAGLKAVDPDTDVVVVHDAARPCFSPALLSEVVASAKKHGSGVAAAKITDTVKTVDRGVHFSGTLDRSTLWAVQTPQAFNYEQLMIAFEKVYADGKDITDESSAFDYAGLPCRLVPAPPTNIKITTVEDVPLAAAMLGIN